MHTSSEGEREILRDLLGGIKQGPPDAETMRALRAIWVLERIGTKEAQEILRKLADGCEGARQTKEAREALKRLEAMGKNMGMRDKE
jgi:hypothetical protein